MTRFHTSISISCKFVPDNNSNNIFNSIHNINNNIKKITRFYTSLLISCKFVPDITSTTATTTTTIILKNDKIQHICVNFMLLQTFTSTAATTTTSSITTTLKYDKIPHICVNFMQISSRNSLQPQQQQQHLKNDDTNPHICFIFNFMQICARHLQQQQH